jgi:SnoaL-like domain
VHAEGASPAERLLADPANFAQRLDRIESRQELWQLPSRYALALDGRNLDELVGLFVEDVNSGRRGQGRPALREFFDEVLRNFYRSVHQICGQTLQLDSADPNRATGTAYCRAEHEEGAGWYVMTILYSDDYERQNGNWYFARRRERHWYSTEIERRPTGPRFQDWPDQELLRPTLPQAFPTWNEFWFEADADSIDHLTRFP